MQVGVGVRVHTLKDEERKYSALQFFIFVVTWWEQGGREVFHGGLHFGDQTACSSAGQPQISFKQNFVEFQIPSFELLLFQLLPHVTTFPQACIRCSWKILLPSLHSVARSQLDSYR